MKTKHLFFATALVASFASCTNDDIAEVQQGVANVERPTVEDVRLNFVAEGVDSRLAFGSNGYAWEATDKIGALLMDQPTADVADEDADWTEKYALVNYISTSYPFAYNTEDKTWSCEGKMLEGNYFFAFPWSNYEGSRTVKHSLLTQAQKGIGTNVVAKAYAENQWFIGYSQIKGGVDATDVLTDVEMTPVLGALQLRIKNTGDKTYHINKIVVSGEGVASELTVNPTNAIYSGTATEDEEPNGLDFTLTNYFNYANYVGDVENVDAYQINEENEKFYNRADALRAVVNPIEDAREVAYLNIEGTESERALASGKTAYALIMLNPITLDGSSQVKINMYTDEGVVELTADLGSMRNLSDEFVTTILPGVSNTVVFEFEDADVDPTDGALNVYTEEDLALFVDWNKTATTVTPVTLNLMSDITLTKDVFNAMKSTSKVTWTLAGEEGIELTLADDLPANILEYAKLTIDDDLNIVAEGTIDFTAKSSEKIDALTIEEGAVMNIKVDVDGTEVVLPSITNKGTLNIAAVQVLGANAITNAKEGVINVAATADVKATTSAKLTNNGTINNAGYMQYVTNNAGAVINMTGAAVLKDLVNNGADTAAKLAEGKVNAAAGTTIDGTNAGLIALADDTVVLTVSDDNGKVALEVTGNIAKNDYEDMSINALIIKGTTTFAGVQDDIKHIITTDGSELKLSAAASFSALSLKTIEVNGATKVTTVLSGDNKNNVTVETLTINKGATLTNNGKIIVTSAFSNEEGKVINNQSIDLPTGAVKGNWLYNNPGTYTPGVTNPVDHHYLCLGTGNATTYKYGTNLEALAGMYDANDIVEELVIRMNLNMDAKATTENKTNKDFASVLEKAKLVKFGDAQSAYSISNLKESYAVTANEFIVNRNVTISGTTNMVLLTVDKLKVTSKLTVNDGYLAISGTAVEGKGCEAIEAAATTLAGTGAIVAYNAAGELLFWNKNASKWQKDDVRLNVQQP